MLQLSCVRLMNDLPGFVETPQGKGVGGEIQIQICIIRRNAHGLPSETHGLLMLPL